MPSGGLPNTSSVEGSERDAGVGGELRLVDLGEEHDALVGDVLLQPLDGLGHGIGALELDDAVILGGARRGKRGDGKGAGDERRQSKYRRKTMDFSPLGGRYPGRNS